MLHDALDAFARLDAKQAVRLIAQDAAVDHEFRSIMRNLITFMMEDPRTISAALDTLWVAKAIERIGDHAADISEITIMLANNKYIKKLEHIQQMAKETTIMVVTSIDAFVNKDAALAQKVIDQDDVVDELFVTIKRDLLAMINENIENGEQAMDLLMVAKYFERIGDHAVNIAEWVIFSITGEHKK